MPVCEIRPLPSPPPPLSFSYSILGLEFFAAGLQRNSHLIESYLPVCDVASILKKEAHPHAAAEKLHTFVDNVQSHITTNTHNAANGLNPAVRL